MGELAVDDAMLGVVTVDVDVDVDVDGAVDADALVRTAGLVALAKLAGGLAIELDVGTLGRRLLRSEIWRVGFGFDLGDAVSRMGMETKASVNMMTTM